MTTAALIKKETNEIIAAPIFRLGIIYLLFYQFVEFRKKISTQENYNQRKHRFCYKNKESYSGSDTPISQHFQT